MQVPVGEWVGAGTLQGGLPEGWGGPSRTGQARGMGSGCEDQHSFPEAVMAVAQTGGLNSREALPQSLAALPPGPQGGPLLPLPASGGLSAILGLWLHYTNLGLHCHMGFWPPACLQTLRLGDIILQSDLIGT